MSAPASVTIRPAVGSEHLRVDIARNREPLVFYLSRVEAAELLGALSETLEAKA